MEKCEYEKVSKMLFLWFTQQSDRGIPYHRPHTTRESSDFPNGWKPDFKASADNFDHWKKLYRLQQLNI
jgi:hypothetical protein